MLVLRDFQEKLKQEIYAAWHSGHRNVLGVSPTGSGKTVVFSDIFRDMQNNHSVAIAHRQELVSQISLALARNGIYHNIHASNQVVKFCITQHLEELGQKFYDAQSPVATSGVRTLLSRRERLKQWASKVQMWTLDEAHHALVENQWGSAINLFPNAWGLGVTASPIRTDKKALGVKFGGIFNHMVIGPGMRELITRGFLSDYRIYAPSLSIDVSNVQISATTGDLNQTQLRKEAHKSTITGDIVEHYMKLTHGKRGITFAVDVQQAQEIADKFNAAGVKAAAVSGDTNDVVRADCIRRFRDGQLSQLVNVDLFGEGFDVPACEVVSMGRPTQSFGLYLQQFGRALRTFEGKTHGIILDHVGNVKRHGLPDARSDWTLDVDYKVPSTKREFVMPMRTCMNCFSMWEAYTKTCPYCGYEDIPESRGLPEFVDGDLVEFSPELLAQLRGDANYITNGNPLIPQGATDIVIASRKKHHREWQETQAELIDVMNTWGGIQQQVFDRTQTASYRLFYHKFGIDVLSAQSLKMSEMKALAQLVRDDFDEPVN